MQDGLFMRKPANEWKSPLQHLVPLEALVLISPDSQQVKLHSGIAKADETLKKRASAISKRQIHAIINRL